MDHLRSLLDSVCRRFPDERLTPEATWEYCVGNQIHVIEVNSLSPLDEISSPPVLLFVKGEVKCLSQPALAIVGTRRPSPYGIRSALLYGRALVRAGFTVVSGLARGIDSHAHQGALVEKGATAAVMGHGLDRVYPAENTRLANRILDGGGCLVSEYPPGVPPLKHHFPQRNRIIAGLSKGVLVIQAAEKSGSLITARWAADFGREVFVLPSHYDENSFSGSHRLIQEGAKLVTNVREMLEEFPGYPAAAETAVEEDRDFLSWVGPFGATLTEIVDRGRMEIAEAVKRIEKALNAGSLVEISDQCYHVVPRK